MKHQIIFAAFLCTTAFAACSGDPATQNKATVVTQTDTATVADAGQTLFEAKCASCHGSDGTAGIGNAANLHLSKLDTVAIAQTVSDGRNAMPSFKSQLSKDELRQLAHYVYTLRQ